MAISTWLWHTFGARDGGWPLSWALPSVAQAFEERKYGSLEDVMGSQLDVVPSQ